MSPDDWEKFFVGYRNLLKYTVGNDTDGYFTEKCGSGWIKVYGEPNAEKDNQDLLQELEADTWGSGRSSLDPKSTILSENIKRVTWKEWRQLNGLE